jgi:hypothetical protein
MKYILLGNTYGFARVNNFLSNITDSTDSPRSLQRNGKRKTSFWDYL